MTTQHELLSVIARVRELEERRCEICGYAEHHREHTGCLRKQVSSLKAENDMDNNTLEKRCCDECGHTGIDGGSTSESYCGACGATVPYPDEDLCPSCGAENCMLIACPECGGRYPLDDGVWLHHSMDGRDAFETGERLPS